jgi:N-acetylmuramoyl-L-alanine amidase
MNKFYRILFISVVISQCFAATSINVVNQVNNTSDLLKVLDKTPVNYCSIKDLARILTTNIYESSEREKLVLYLGDHRVKISAGTTFILIDEKTYQIPLPAILVDDDMYLPTEAFFTILSKTAMPRATYDPINNILTIVPTKYNISDIHIEEKANGTIIRIEAEKKFKKRELSTFLHDNGWFYITAQGGSVDTTEIIKTDTRGIVQRISVEDLEGGIQLAFYLRSEIERHEISQNKKTNEIVVTLWAPLSKSVARIKEVKSQWEIDTIVLDAGHGGKDPGTSGKSGTKEKTIVLDIAKRVGNLVQKNTNVKVVYTRDEDVFIPLWERAKIANENNGKIFISIHANASRDRSAHGFETFLLRPGKTQDAIEVAALENAAIKYEENRNDRYKNFTDEGQILATMAQSMFMKESESLAALIQTEIDKESAFPNRGVKQAGFYVLVGASMPNVLIEVGFLSNPEEERQLRSPQYRQKIAKGIYRAIIEFKKNREFVMAES